MYFTKALGKGLLLLGIGASISCGDESLPGINNGNSSSERDAGYNDLGSKTDSGESNSDSGINFGDSSSLDGRIADSGGVNQAPTIRFILPNGTIYSRRNVNRQTDVNYEGDVNDPDGDSVQCRFEFSDGDPPKDWSPDCYVIHAVRSLGNYTLTGRIRDSKGLEGISAEVELTVLDGNLPPVAVLSNCQERGADGRQICRMKVGEDFCWDASGSYDEDGEIREYNIQLEPRVTIGGIRNPRVCGYYNQMGIYNSIVITIDNHGAEGSLPFVNIVTPN
jgi:hypothetical protein